MNREEKKRYLRLIYARTFRMLSIGLVISAIVGGIYGDTMYTVFAMCAVGSVLICWGWFLYLRLGGMRVFGFKPNAEKIKVPYIHRRFKDKRPHRPAFRKDSTDFDDDLTAATMVDESAFSEHAAEMARIWARVVSGVLLFLISFLI